MWRLAVSVALQAGLSAVCAAQSLHLAPAGTVVSGSFDLAGKSIPLPAGEFVLAATRIEEARVVSVFLAQLDGDRLKSAVWASGGVQVREPCARSCLVVEQRVGSFGADTIGLMHDAAAWLAYHDVVVPVPLLIVAEVTRLEAGDQVHAAYAFNPWSYGCDRASPQFVDSVAAWGKQVQRHFDGVVTSYSSGIHQCASALASTP